MGEMTVREYYVINRPSDTLVFHCVDHRFQEAFSKYIFKELKIDVFNPIVIAGGAYALCNNGGNKHGFIWDQIDFFIDKAGIKRIVLINHDDCKWYKLENPDLGITELENKGKSDLALASAKIKEKYPGIEIISVWAKLSGDMVKFYKMD